MRNLLRNAFKHGNVEAFFQIIGWLAAGGIVMFLLTLLLHAEKADAQQTRYTKCTDGKQVIFVTDFTCPPGWWRTQ